MLADFRSLPPGEAERVWPGERGMGTRTGYCARRRSPQESEETPAKKKANRKRLAFMHLVEQCFKRYAQNVTHPQWVSNLTTGYAAQGARVRVSKC